MEKIMRLHRIGRTLYLNNIPLIPRITTKMIRFIFSAEIPFTCDIGKNVHLKHGGLGIVLHDRTVIGENCVIYQHVTLAGIDGKAPQIGNNVLIGTGAVIIGGVKIGNNAKIGANAVVINDVPENSTAVGVPAKII
jgi:serine O-acetyltransferase